MKGLGLIKYRKDLCSLLHADLGMHGVICGVNVWYEFFFISTVFWVTKFISVIDLGFQEEEMEASQYVHEEVGNEEGIIGLHM